MGTLIGFIAAVCGIVTGYICCALIARWQADSIKKQAAAKLEAAETEAARRLREADIRARAEVVRAKEEFETEADAKRKELDELDTSLSTREENLERKLKVVEDRENEATIREKNIEETTKTLNERKARLDELVSDADKQLQRLAGMTAEEARVRLRKKVEDSVRSEMGALVRRLNEEARENAERDARIVVANAIERFAAPQAFEIMTATVNLPSEEIKSRIVGKDGRNVRAIEAATGMTLLVDCTPGAVVISGFNPIRREIARLTLEDLVADGRIHPARIEEAVQKATENMEAAILQAGKDAAITAKQKNLSNEVLTHLGRLKFRSSYTQNVLQHSVEVAALMGALAEELGLDGALARRVGLLHDIGKSLSLETEGSHARIGADLLRKAHENPVVVNAVESHHDDAEKTSIYAVLCAAADTISATRPGARNEDAGVYIDRVARLEKIAMSRKGVRKAFAVQAGRELRVIVDPEKLNDNDTMLLAQNVSKAIENELTYPGQIRVIVIRETRCMEYAR